MRVFDLTPRGPLHVGEWIGVDRESALEHIPSDTLFAALVVAWARRGDDISAMLREVQSAESEFCLTSVFPRAGSVRFFPRPLIARASLTLSPKTWRRVRWVSRGIWDGLCGAGNVPEGGHFLHDGQIWLTTAEYATVSPFLGSDDARLWQTVTVPHVTIDRARNAGNLFHSGQTVFASGCGMWFAAKGAASLLTHVTEGLALLADTGLGGLRSTGHGGFVVDSAHDTADPVAYSTGVLLSRYAPDGADELRRSLLEPGCAYALVRVGGWCQDDTGKAWRRRTVRMVKEGSVIGLPAHGRLVDVRPTVMNRPVIRFGRAFVWTKHAEAA